ncbi:MAG: ribosome maturation factor RimM [Lachnospiraceae bacterium]|nr:ribosome maturation factor RimM [Lachnospiraceae bacterium]
MEEFFRVGVISSTHGVRGEVKVFPTTDDVQRFKKLKEVLLDTGKEKLPLEIQGVKFFKQFAILKFKGYDNINDIEKYKGKELWVTRENAVPLEENEYYIADLIGLTVISDKDEELGTLTDVLQTGANDVYVVKLKNGKEGLFPAISDCVQSVDIEKGIMVVHVMEGLLD